DGQVPEMFGIESLVARAEGLAVGANWFAECAEHSREIGSHIRDAHIELDAGLADLPGVTFGATLGHVHLGAALGEPGTRVRIKFPASFEWPDLLASDL